MYYINEDVVFVKGAKNGAIYDLLREKVYSINAVGCRIIDSYVKGHIEDKEQYYIEQLKQNRLLSFDFAPRACEMIRVQDTGLEMAWLEITQTCNMRCIHCYEGDMHKSSENILSLGEWIEVIDQLAKEGINRLIVIGGEPGCYINLRQILEHTAIYNFKTVLFTNASLLTEELMECIIKCNTIVKVSVYGPNAEIHDRVTSVKGSFDRLVKAIKFLVEHGVYVEAAIIMMLENQDYLDETIAFVKAIGMHYKKYDVIREVFEGKQSVHIPTNKDLINKVSLVRPNFHITKDKFFKNQHRNTCWYGKITILENGNVVPCEFERSIVYGNIREKSIAEILKNTHTRMFWNYDFSKIENCKDCEYRYACKDCRPLGRAVCGKMSTKNPRCKYDVYSGVWDSENDN